MTTTHRASQSLPIVSVALSFLLLGCPGPSDKQTTPDPTPTPVAKTPPPLKAFAEEVHLTEIKQLTYDSGENAEAYWSYDNQSLIFQTKRPPYKCDQIMTVRADGSGEPQLVSTGKGRTTCAYYLPGNQRTVWASTHEGGPECPPEPDMSRGYVWALYDTYDIYTSDTDGGNLVKLTKEPGYDAEATVCPVDGSIVFTSTRSGDIELWRMDKDGGNLKQLTNLPGYDGGAFFSPDCTKLLWRASRPTGERLADYKGLLARGLVRPSRLELFVANADGSDARQITSLGAATFAPYWHPNGKRVLFSTNYPNPRGREFDIYAINIDGTDLERITYAPGFDGFPMFSFDGKKLAFASNRNQAKDGETDVYVATWVDTPPKTTAGPAERFRDDVAWLADDAREGRGVGTKGLDAAAGYIEKRFRELGLAPAFGDSFRQSVEVPVAVTVNKNSRLSVGRQIAGVGDFVPASFSKNGAARGRTVFVGYGIVGKDVGIDDYKGVRVKGRVAVIRRFVPDSDKFKEEKLKRRYSDMHYKAYLARERGAKAVIFVDSPEVAKGAKPPSEADLPRLELARLKDIGIPVVIAKRSVAEKLTTQSSPVSINVQIDRKMATTDNVAAVVRAGAPNKLPGVVVIGAHYDHLGMGGESSLEPGVSAPHNGADDNASGTAGLLEAGRSLAAVRAKLRRDVVLVAFTAEEMGLLGSSHFVTKLPNVVGKDKVVAMLNMDMIGRLREGGLAVLGGATASEWDSLVTPMCAKVGIACSLAGDGYGPSDQTPFYASGVPVLHFFTGAHGDYHKSTDDADAVNSAGGAKVAWVVTAVAEAVANRQDKLTYKRVAAPLPAGDSRSFGASLGTIPDYAAKGGVAGVPLSGVRPGGPAEKGGLRKGDVILRIGQSDVKSVHDLVYVLRSAKPGQRVPIVVLRAGKRQTFKVTYGKSTRRRR